MKRALPGVLVAAVALICAPAARAVPITFTALLDGASEFPPVASPGTGSTVVTFDIDAHTLRVEVDFTGLIGTTMAAHIHCCIAPSDPMPIAGVATQTPTFAGFPVGVTSGVYDNTFDTLLAASFNAAFVTATGGTVAGAEAALFAGLQAGEAYLNIHTTFAGAGEIRGFLQAQVVPEPAALAVFCLGLAAIGLMRRRRPA